MIPQFPVYIVSKGRSNYMITSRVLSDLGIQHFVVVEPQEVQRYEEAVKERNLLTTVLSLDMSYKDKYNLLDNLGLTKSTGPGPARNFAWDHSIGNGFEWHWVMDDNIHSFRRLNFNEKVKVSNGAIFKAMEDFCLRYENVGMAGPNYFMFASARVKQPPFVTNTRIYSCNLIRNNLPFRWRGRYNEDTILSLDILKRKICTIQFNSFLQEKSATQTIPGGNTAEFYNKEGTLAKSQMLRNVYPDCSVVTFKFNRWHHSVNYKIFSKLKLIKKVNSAFDPKINNYGMKLAIKDKPKKIARPKVTKV